MPNNVDNQPSLVGPCINRNLRSNQQPIGSSFQYYSHFHRPKPLHETVSFKMKYLQIVVVVVGGGGGCVGGGGGL